jgi:hypothetical protein
MFDSQLLVQERVKEKEKRCNQMYASDAMLSRTRTYPNTSQWIRCSDVDRVYLVSVFGDTAA